MSAVNLCERCDTLMLGKAVTVLTVTVPEDGGFGVGQTKRIEICPGCTDDFQSFLVGYLTGKRPRTYRQPYPKPIYMRDEADAETPAITE